MNLKKEMQLGEPSRIFNKKKWLRLGRKLSPFAALVNFFYFKIVINIINILF